MISKRLITRIGMIGIGTLVIIGIAMSALHYLIEPYNPGFTAYPTITLLHIIPGALYLGLAPFQFSKFFRSKWLGTHRRLGRLLSILGFIVGLTALFMAIVFPFSGTIESISVSVFGAVFLFSLIRGYLAVRAKKISEHREWMLRAFALGLAIATSRLIFLPFFFAIANPALQEVQFLFIGSFVSAFTIHLILAELWIRHTRQSQL